MAPGGTPAGLEKLLDIHLKLASVNITGTIFHLPSLATKCHVVLVDIII